MELNAWVDYKGKYSNKSSWCSCLWLSKPYEGTLFSCYTHPCFSGTGSNLPLPEFPTLLPLITSWRVMKHFKFCVKLTGVVGAGKALGNWVKALGCLWAGAWGGNVISQGSALGSGCCWQGVLSNFSWEFPAPIQCQLHIFSQIFFSPSVTFIWKFWAETVPGCRTEGGSPRAPHLLPTHRKS